MRLTRAVSLLIASVMVLQSVPLQNVFASENIDQVIPEQIQASETSLQAGTETSIQFEEPTQSQIPMMDTFNVVNVQISPVGASLPVTATLNNQSVSFNGAAPVTVQCYNIGGYNYFRIRDICKPMNYYVDKDASGDLNAVSIQPDVPYDYANSPTLPTLTTQTASVDLIDTHISYYGIEYAVQNFNLDNYNYFKVADIAAASDNAYASLSVKPIPYISTNVAYDTQSGIISINGKSIYPGSITYYANGGAGMPPASQNFTDGAAVTIAQNSGLTKSGFIFNGWNTKADGTGIHYAAGASYVLSGGGITLYAEWAADTTATIPNNASPLAWPTATNEVTFWYGSLDDVAASIKNPGIDIQDIVGAQVFSICDGVVSFSDADPTSGGFALYVNFMYNSKYMQARYTNLISKSSLTVGQSVNREAPIKATMSTVGGKGLLRLIVVQSTDGNVCSNDLTNNTYIDPASIMQPQSATMDYLLHPMSVLWNGGSTNDERYVKNLDLNLNPNSTVSDLSGGEVYLRRPLGLG